MSAWAAPSSPPATTAVRYWRRPESKTWWMWSSTGWSRPVSTCQANPRPDTYLAASRALGVPASLSAVYEDALAGVAAGRAGGFGWVVGVDRGGQAAALRTEGADVVVSDLAELLGRS
jgi:phosphoglycolate phosphatase-like HAD superfamily hydrolase